MTENIDDFTRRVSEAQSLREAARRAMQMAQEDGMVHFVAEYQKIIERWDKFLQPLEHPAANESENAR